MSMNATQETQSEGAGSLFGRLLREAAFQIPAKADATIRVLGGLEIWGEAGISERAPFFAKATKNAKGRTTYSEVGRRVSEEFCRLGGLRSEGMAQ